MNAKLWNQIAAFSFDKPNEEYSFSVRLADENKWTRAFTQKAILEYKKFMYLAATSKSMVSPSEIVDIVWHQHLIFTKSYKELCQLLGKQIQHIPSTHNPEEFEKFRDAKIQTQKIYTESFGEQPADIWEHREMHDILGLKKAKRPIIELLSISILASIALILPAYYMLRPVYEKIHGMAFIFGYVLMIVLVISFLNLYNHSYLQGVVARFSKQSFLYNLHPLELLYLMTNSVPLMLHGYVNQLLTDRKILSTKEEDILLNKRAKPSNEEEERIFKILSLAPKTSYTLLLQTLATKHIFTGITSSMDAFKDRFKESKIFSDLYILNFTLISFTLILGLVRLITGMLRDKPVLFLASLLLIFLLLSANHLYRLDRDFFTTTIPHYYNTDLAETLEPNIIGHRYVVSTAFIATSYLTLPKEYRSETKQGGYCGGDSSCGGGCGSSCGGGCGGCGGCGG